MYIIKENGFSYLISESSEESFKTYDLLLENYKDEGFNIILQRTNDVSVETIIYNPIVHIALAISIFKKD